MKKYIAITGASSGIGYETAKRFARRGVNLILIAGNKSKLVELKEEILKIAPTLFVILKSVDLSITDNVYQLYDSLKEYDIISWINNAGLGDYCPVDKLDFSKMEQMLHLNVIAVALLSSLYTRDNREKENAQLINVSSAGGYTLVPTAVTFLMQLYDSTACVWRVNRETFEFELCDYQFDYAGNSIHNQTVE